MLCNVWINGRGYDIFLWGLGNGKGYYTLYQLRIRRIE